MLIGITDYVTPPFDLELEGFLSGGGVTPEIVAFDAHTEADLLASPRLGQVEALLVWHAPITAAVARALTACKVVVRYGVGYDAIDVGALAARGIPFCNTPDYGTEEVADTACAMLLGLSRRVRAYDRACRTYAAGWQEHVMPPIVRSNHQTLGVIGVGRIGTAVINRMRAFGFHIVGYDPYQPAGHEKAVGYERARSLEDLLRRADVVTIHCPLTPETRGMVNAGFLAAMKPGAMLVNTARGEILDGLDPLAEALRSGHLDSCALDVLPQEPPGSHPLIAAWRADADWLGGRLLINPHSAYYSAQAWREMRLKTAETAALALSGQPLRNHIPAPDQGARP